MSNGNDIYTYIHTYIHTYLHTFIHSFIYIYIHGSRLDNLCYARNIGPESSHGLMQTFNLIVRPFTTKEERKEYKKYDYLTKQRSATMRERDIERVCKCLAKEPPEFAIE